MATVAYLEQNLQNGSRKYSINQPGGIIESEINKENGIIKKITIGGVVKIKSSNKSRTIAQMTINVYNKKYYDILKINSK